MVERFLTPLCGTNEQVHLFADHRLTDVFRQPQGANGAIQLLIALATAGRDDTIRFMILHHALEGAADHFFTAQFFFLYGGHCPAGLLRFEAQGDQSADRIILGA